MPWLTFNRVAVLVVCALISFQLGHVFVGVSDWVSVGSVWLPDCVVCLGREESVLDGDPAAVC